jgi:hypothetical protein
LGNITLDVSHSGRFLSVLWENDKEYDIYRTDTWQRVATGNQTSYLVWCNTDDRFAVLKGQNLTKKISLYCIRNFSIQVISENVPVTYTVKCIFGGVLLGVLYQDTPDDLAFHFISWSGQESKGGLLPKPENVLWDSLSSQCLMVYGNSIYFENLTFCRGLFCGIFV